MAQVQLTGFLREAAETEWQYGQTDCSMTIANWVHRATGKDPGAPLRGRYSTQIGWRRLVARQGGLGAVWGALAEAAGLEPTSRPAPGDIGLVRIPGQGIFGAIRTPRGWFVKQPDRILIAPFKTIAAWKV